MFPIDTYKFGLYANSYGENENPLGPTVPQVAETEVSMWLVPEPATNVMNTPLVTYFISILLREISHLWT
jgi:hypothetical protein